jgi:hypothetical protein
MTPEDLQALSAARGRPITAPAPAAPTPAPVYVGGPPLEQGGGRGAEYVPPAPAPIIAPIIAPIVTGKTVTNTYYSGTGTSRIKITTYSDGSRTEDAAPISSTESVVPTDNGETATSILTNTLKFYGLNDPALVNEIRAALANRTITGSSTIDEIGIQLRESPAFKQRFIANERRRELGKPVYSVSQLLTLESQYRRNLRDSGMPAGFYDDPVSLQNFLINDISPDEILARVTQGYQAVRNADPTVVNELKTLYNLDDGSIAAFFVDPNKAQDNILRAARAAEVAAQARKQAGIGLTATTAEELVRQGVTESEAQAGFTTYRQQESLYRPLMGEEAITQEEAIAGTLGTSAQAAQRIATTKRRRKGTFEAGGKTSLATVE